MAPHVEACRAVAIRRGTRTGTVIDTDRTGDPLTPRLPFFSQDNRHFKDRRPYPTRLVLGAPVG